MASTYYGVVKDHVIVLPDNADLEDGTEVEVRVLTPSDAEGHLLSPGSPLAELFISSELMRDVKPPLRSLPEGDRTLIHVAGEPLSETIIRDRR